MDECKRGFYWTSQAWYSESLQDDMKHRISFGLYVPNDGTCGEACMHWIDIGNRGNNYTARLEAFEDSWQMLASVPDLITRLGELDGENISEEHFVQILLELGFEDQTPRENPYLASQDTKLISEAITDLNKALMSEDNDERAKHIQEATQNIHKWAHNQLVGEEL